MMVAIAYEQSRENLCSKFKSSRFNPLLEKVNIAITDEKFLEYAIISQFFFS